MSTEGMAWQANYVRTQNSPEVVAPPPDRAPPIPAAGPPSSLAARACYFLLGAGLLAAWNALITATDYFSTVYPGWHTDRLFTVAYLPVCMVLLAFGIRFPDLPPGPVRIRLGYAGFTAAMAAVPLLDALLVAPSGGDGGSAAAAPVGALVAVLVCVGLVGACDGLCQGALFAEAAQLPPPYTHALVSGTASSGLLVCLLRIASKASFEASHADPALGLRNGTRLYFALAGLLSLSCLVLYDGVLPWLRSLPSRAQRPGEQARGAASASTNHRHEYETERHPLLPQPQPQRLELSTGCGSSHGSAGIGGGDVSRTCSGGSGVGADPWGAVEAQAPPVSVCVQEPHAVDGAGGAGGSSDDHRLGHRLASAATASDSPYGWPTAASSGAGGADGGLRPTGVLGGGGGGPQLRRCVALSWALCCSLFLTYTTTLSIFPGFLAEDVHSDLLGDWYPILLITAFNLADLVGKCLPCLEPHRGEGTDARRHQQEPASPLRPASERSSGTACSRLVAPALAALLLPLRRPRGLLLVAVLRGVTALPAFLAAARWEAPAWMMATLTAVLGVSNGYLTSQVLTMGPSAVLAPPPPMQAQRKRGAGRQPDDGDGSTRGASGSDYWPLPATDRSGDGASGAPDAAPRRAAAAIPGSGAVAGYVPVKHGSLDDAALTGDDAAIPCGGSKPGGYGAEVHGADQGPHVDAEVVESLLVLSLVAGLNVGAYLGWLWLL